MNFSGTIDAAGGMTVTRLIERIVHSDTPGELRLHDEPGGRRASVAIRRGAVQEVRFGDLTGDAALTAISQVMPWSFEFVSDEAGALPSHPSMISRRPRARAVVRTAGPSVVSGTASGQSGQPDDHVPSLTEAHRAWIATPSSAYCIHFGIAGTEFAGEVHADDHDYFRSDYEFVMTAAASIARSLGCEPPAVVAIAEAERSTGYAAIPGGFLGIIGGAGTGVEHVIAFPPS